MRVEFFDSSEKLIFRVPNAGVKHFIEGINKSLRRQLFLNHGFCASQERLQHTLRRHLICQMLA